MTAEKLIELLSKLPPNTKIVVYAYDCNGYNDLERAEELDIVPHRHPDSYGAGKYDVALGEAEKEEAFLLA